MSSTPGFVFPPLGPTGEGDPVYPPGTTRDDFTGTERPAYWTNGAYAVSYQLDRPAVAFRCHYPGGSSPCDRETADRFIAWAEGREVGMERMKNETPSREAQDIERQRRWLNDERMERLAQFMFESGYGGDYFFGGPGRHTDRKDGSSWVAYTWDELHNAHKRGWREKAVRVLEHLDLEPGGVANGN